MRCAFPLSISSVARTIAGGGIPHSSGMIVARPRNDAMTFSELQEAALRFRAELKARKEGRPDVPWYPYDSIANFWHLEHIVPADDLVGYLRRGPVLDIGTADGDVAFFAEREFGTRVTAIDNPPTNNADLRGFRTMKQMLGSAVSLVELDLDTYFPLDGKYEFAFFLGVLYHLKNPFHVLEKLAGSVQAIVVSTRITKHSRPQGVDISDIPAAYLLEPHECNNDSTNYWIFTEAGLRRLFSRTGWDILAFRAVGAENSDPYTMENDQRAFCYLKSNRYRA
jgi:tRNA (mo5U34)-methyltransferase